MLTHGNVLANAAMGAEVLPLVAGERVGMMLPLFHVNAQIVTCVIPMMVGCEVAMWERFSASTFWQTVAELEPVALSAVPTILAAVLHTANAPTGPTSLRYIICGAAPLSRELLEAFEERFDIRILEGYGLTESTCVSSLNPYYGVRKPGSIGLPVRGQQMKIVAPDGSPGRRRRARRDRGQGPERDGRLSAQPGGDGHDDPRRLAAHRRRRLRRLRRVLLHRRPRQGHDHPRRREHLPARDRGGAVHARRRAGVRGDRRAARGPRRGSPRRRRAETGRRARRRSAQGVCRRAPRRVQGATTLRDPPRAPQERHRQDQQAATTRGIRPLGARRREAAEQLA